MERHIVVDKFIITRFNNFEEKLDLNPGTMLSLSQYD